MKVEVTPWMTGTHFTVLGWTVTSPSLLRQNLQVQLDAAAAVWPELKKYSIKKEEEKSDEGK